MKVGYCRVSSTDQSTDVQRQQLEAAGAERIFEEKVSGKNTTDRAQLQAMLAFIREGDTLLVSRLDRLARSLPDLFEIVKALEEKGAQLTVLNNSAIDTTNPMGRCVFAIFGAIAELERSLIRERQAEGVRAARARGVYKGRPPKIQRERVFELRDGGMGPAEIARTLEISESSVFRLLAGRNTMLPVTDATRMT